MVSKINEMVSNEKQMFYFDSIETILLRNCICIELVSVRNHSFIAAFRSTIRGHLLTNQPEMVNFLPIVKLID